MDNVKILVFRDEDSLADRAAARLAEMLLQRISKGHSVSIALCGGRSPVKLYERFFDMQLPWHMVRVFQTDERYVSPEDGLSNQRMLYSIVSKRCPEAIGNFIAVDTSKPLYEAALAYEQRLRELLPEGVLDAVVLGLGEDCHIASLFADSPLLAERDRWVIPVEEPPVPPQRITLTLPLLMSSRWTLILAIGSKKEKALKMLLDREIPSTKCPAKYLSCLNTTEVWATEDASVF